MADSIEETVIEILFFGKARELVKLMSSELTLPKSTTSEKLFSSVLCSFPELRPLDGYFVLALDQDYLERDSAQQVNLSPRSQLAVIPPISGDKVKMTNFVKLTNDVLDVGEITTLVSDESTGAVSIFVGTTRNHFGGKTVLKLFYEAYEPMAVKKMGELCVILRQKWRLHNVAIYHRLGEVPPKEASVVIAVTSEHRQASLEAVAFAIDTLKATVPIWKKEVYGDGGDEWKANAECQWSNNNRPNAKN